MSRLLMLDSGAFTVWTKGAKIDLDEYIDFCEKHPAVSYYVVLDVIPGKRKNPLSFMSSSVEIACEEGWDNYQRMLKRLPIEKVIPVFHYGESVRWLEKYLDFGVPYIGISLGNNRTTSQKREWLDRYVRPIVLDSEGHPIVKIHGFAVTSFPLMKYWRWESVDSSTWTKLGGMGSVFLPVEREGEFCYSEPPLIVGATERPSPDKPKGFLSVPGSGVNQGSNHLLSLPPKIKRSFDRYLAENHVTLGEYEVVNVAEDYKIKNRRKERWANKEHTKVIRVERNGVMTSHLCRKWLNMRFMQRAAEVLPVEHLYLAGFVGEECEKIEKEIRDRLISYWFVLNSPVERRIFFYHLERCSENDKVSC